MSCLVCLSVCRVQVGLMLENEGFFFFFFFLGVLSWVCFIRKILPISESNHIY